MPLGGQHPVRIQSMTNKKTMNTEATAKQVLALAEAGCEMVRIAARNKTEAANLKNIKNFIARYNCHVPLVADIHFLPEAAEVAARIVEKVRINPGNFLDKSLFLKKKTTVYDENLYQQELENISLRLKPLLNICKEYGTVIRIGVNHGSLSERVTWRYGNTAEGMVASAKEYIEICRLQGFHNLVISMKSSDVKTMVYAYRLLVIQMIKLGYDYPLHLGVTETGAGIDARLKSAAGIGTLLLEGIGDTIRVSLTEDPLKEIPIAKLLVDNFGKTKKKQISRIPKINTYNKTFTYKINCLEHFSQTACVLLETQKKGFKEVSPDFYLDKSKKYLSDADTGIKIPVVFLRTEKYDVSIFNKQYRSVSALMFDFSDCKDLFRMKKQLKEMRKQYPGNPLLIYKNYPLNKCETDLSLIAATEFSFFLIDGMIDGICIDMDTENTNLKELMFGILQATGLRRIKAEFVACPTCGRTSYDVEEALKMISEKLSHLKHLKIGVMGCVVNGPGEMADADYGYVGTTTGKINLYRKQQLVSKNITESEAMEKLIELIKNDGNWVES